MTMSAHDRVRRTTRRAHAALALLLCVACASRAATTDRDESASSRTVTETKTAATLDPATSVDTMPSDSESAAGYEGVDSRGIPHYATRILSPADSTLLRQAFGIEDPHRLYVSDSTEEGILKYDTQRKRCRTCYVNSYRVGYVSVRRPGESWEEAERRVRGTAPAAFFGSPHPSSTSTADLDPDVRPLADAMMHDARAAGFHLRITATYRSPQREAFLMAEGRGRTHTLTSNHSYGRALDIVVDEGDRASRRTHDDWVAFRRWVTHYKTSSGVHFRVLGRLDHTWDWPHVELPSATIGFDTIDEAIARARTCLAAGATLPCNFAPHLPPSLAQPLVQ